MSEYTEQADEFCNKHNVTITFNPLGREVDAEYVKRFKGSGLRTKYMVEVSRFRSDKPIIRETFEYTNSINDTEKKKKPTNYDILACIQKYDPGTFEDFCCEFGYDTDSRKALEIYLAVQQEYTKVNRLFRDVIDELQEIN